MLTTKMRHVAAVIGLMVPPGSGVAQTLPSPKPTVIGINLAEIRYYSASAPFANLAIGSDWSDSGWHHLSEDRVDKDGNLLSVPPDGVVTRFLLAPPTGPEGFDVQCSFTGSGTLDVKGLGGPIKPTPHGLSFHLVNERGKQPIPWLIVSNFDPKTPLRDLDCRDARLPRSVRLRPEFLKFLQGFGVIRFMDWQSTNTNEAVSWQDRHTQNSLRVDRDGVAIEDMMAVVRELHADPWFNVPWNASDDYITRFAQMVRDRLPAGRSVYVEVGNEVWNASFSVGRQAIKEGMERGFGADPMQAAMRRYAQRTTEVMKLWEAAFAGRKGLVRVLATQHVRPETAQTALSFGDTAMHVDALATAPYFGAILGGTGNTRDNSLARLKTELPVALDAITANRQIAIARKLRYIGYEGGVGLALPVQNDLLLRLQHDQAMYDIYQRYLAGWSRKAGDVLCLFNSVSRPSSWGMWGLAEWENDSLAEAPKLRAVRNFMASRPGESRTEP